MAGSPGSKTLLGSAPIDVAIIGGGSAGCVLAARLSEDPSRNVLLVEAGPDIEEGAVPDAIASPYPGRAFFNEAWVWPNLTAVMGIGAGNQAAEARPYEQARILGGGSSINGLGTNRGAPSDYAEWEAAGAAGWGWDNVLPYFRRLETDHDFAGPLHGKTGPLPIRRLPRADWSRYAAQVEKTFGRLGYSARDDQNGVWEDGVFPTATNTDERRQRVGVVAAYLRPEVRRRGNLRIVTETEVSRLMIEGSRVIGFHVRQDGAERAVLARQVIVSAGAIATPVLLMRSGIGAAAALQARGLTVHADLPGVGENLHEHPSIGVSAFLKPGNRQPRGDHYHLPALLRWSSGIAGEPAGDMHTAVVARSGWHAVGHRVGSLFTWVNHTRSRGSVQLGRQAEDAPVVDFRLLSDGRDLARLKQGFRLAVRALSSPDLADAVSDVFPSTYSARIRRFLRPTRRNGALMGMAGPAMDLSATVRRSVLKAAIEARAGAVALAADDAMLEDHLRQHVGGVWHPSGTCKMGERSDRMAVTNPLAQVQTLGGLWVCDGSIMPRIPCANTNVPILMMAEKVSDHVIADPAR